MWARSNLVKLSKQVSLLNVAILVRIASLVKPRSLVIIVDIQCINGA